MPSEYQNEFFRELDAGLRGLAARNQRRSLVEIHGVNFCSNDYLGLAENPLLYAAVLQAVSEARRVGGTGSRLLSGHAAVWDEIEEEFARFAGTEAALYFGSGYSANIGLLTSLLDKQALVFSDALNHASLIDGIRLSGASKVIYSHLDLSALESALREHAHERCRKLIVTETVFSMDGDVAPLPELLMLAERYGAGVIVDEAHATAVHGPRGSGIAAGAGIAANLVAVVHTCSKALASAGAFVCGSALLKEHLIHHARTFIFSTAAPPYMAGQIRAALRLAVEMDAQRTELCVRAKQFSAAIRAGGWDTAGSATQIVPVILGGNEESLAAAEFLRREGFAVRAIRSPTVPEGSARLRFSLTCAIATAELTRMENTLARWRAERPMLAAAGCGA
jgi:8-amino-7-oxononanoate synthase